MSVSVEDLQDESRYRFMLKTSYNEILSFVIDYLKKTTAVTIFLWGSCIIFFAISVYFRISVAAFFTYGSIFLHSILGFVVFPLAIIPIHEILHIIPYYFFGARDIRAGMDLRQYLFYVTAHRFVASSRQFSIVALFPFLLISISLIILIFLLPGLWKWSLSALLFVHATACAGDFALLNFFYINRRKNVLTWDDVDKKEAYYYEKL